MKLCFILARESGLQVLLSEDGYGNGVQWDGLKDGKNQSRKYILILAAE